MSEPKFTPGPWVKLDHVQSLKEVLERLTRSPADPAALLISRHNDNAILAMALRSGGALEEQEANAHLIASAPKLYAVVDAVLKGAQSFPLPPQILDAYLEPIKNILAEARGEKVMP